MTAGWLPKKIANVVFELIKEPIHRMLDRAVGCGVWMGFKAASATNDPDTVSKILEETIGLEARMGFEEARSKVDNEC